MVVLGGLRFLISEVPLYHTMEHDRIVKSKLDFQAANPAYSTVCVTLSRAGRKNTFGKVLALVQMVVTILEKMNRNPFSRK